MCVRETTGERDGRVSRVLAFFRRVWGNKVIEQLRVNQARERFYAELDNSNGDDAFVSTPITVRFLIEMKLSKVCPAYWTWHPYIILLLAKWMMLFILSDANSAGLLFFGYFVSIEWFVSLALEIGAQYTIIYGFVIIVVFSFLSLCIQFGVLFETYKYYIIHNMNTCVFKSIVYFLRHSDMFLIGFIADRQLIRKFW